MTVIDTFTRADNALTLGSTDTGQAWSSDLTWGISSNQAYCASGPASGQATAVVECGQADGTIQITLAVIGHDDAICFRFVDLSNYWIVTSDSTPGNTLGIVVYKQVAGSFSQVAAALPAASAGDILSVVLSGTSIVIKVNGSTIHTISDSTFQTATKHGIRTYTPTTGTTARFADFSFVGASGGNTILAGTGAGLIAGIGTGAGLITGI